METENKIKIEKYFYPMSVTEVNNRPDTPEEILTRWDKFDALSQEEKDILLSSDISIALKKISQKFDLLESESKELSRLIRRLYFKNILKNNFPQELTLKIPRLNFSTAQEMTRVINEQIFNIVVKKKNNDAEVKVIQLSLPEIIEKYPEITNQLITDDYIIVANFSTSVRPSIKNWVADYHDKNGVGKHSPIDRGNYLFHSENGKKLSPVERQKLGIILKSLDEQTALNIDTEKQIVVFENEMVSVQKTSVENKTSNEEPTDIFDLKINTLGRSLQKNTTLQNAAVPGFNKPTNEAAVQNFAAPVQSIANVSRLNNTPSNLPVEKPILANDSHNPSVQIGSAQFNDVKIESVSPRENMERKDSNKTFDFKELHIESKAEDKPKVELKNISFSPNFVAMPKAEDFKSQALRSSNNPLPEHTRTTPLKSEMSSPQPKEEIFSIPGSKPPIGTEHYDVNKAKEEKISALAHKALEALPDPVSNPVLNSDNKKVVEQVSAVKKVPLIQRDENKKVSDTNTNSVNLNDLDSLSDEMLFKLYQEKKNSNNSTNSLNLSKPRGFHIGSAKPVDEDDKIKNIVDLKNL